MTVNRKQINKMEWENPLNWSGPIWMGVYSSRRDSRTWVPKRIPSLGWTVNLGKAAGVAWLIGILSGILLLIALVGYVN